MAKPEITLETLHRAIMRENADNRPDTAARSLDIAKALMARFSISAKAVS